MKENLKFVSPRDRVLYLRSLPGFEGVQTSDLMRIAQHLREVYFKPGELIYQAGSPVKHAYMLVEGSIEFRRNGEVVEVLHAPAPVAFVGVLSGLEQIPGDIVAAVRCVTLEISRRSILQLWEASFPIYANSLRIAAARNFEDRGRWPFAPGSPPDTDPGELPTAPSTLIERVKAMRTAGPFSNTNLEAVVELCRHQTEVRYPKGSVIWTEGGPASFLLRVTYGQVEVSQTGRAESGVIGHDYTLGFFESVGRLPRGYTTIAKTDVVGVRSDIDTMLNVFEDHFDLALSVLGILSLSAVERIWKTSDLLLMAR